MGRTRAAVCCVLLVALAGCSLGGGPATDGTPAGGTATEAGNGSAGTALSLSVGGTVEGAALLAAHEAALTNRSYTYRGGFGTPGGDRADPDRVVRSDGDLADVVSAPVLGRDDGPTALYLTDDAEFTRHGDTAAVRTRATPRSFESVTGAALFDERRTFSVTATRTVDGERRYVLGLGYDDDDADRKLPYARVTVDERGLVRNYTTGTYVPPSADAPGEGVVVDTWFTLSDVGTTTVPEPDWLADIRAAHTAAAGPETVVVERADLDTRLRVTGESVEAEVEAVRDEAFARSPLVERARASPLARLEVEGRVVNATVTMDYDPQETPVDADETNLTVMAFNETLQTYLPLNTTLDRAAGTATATSGPPVTFRTGGGPERRARPTLADSSTDHTVAVMDPVTFYEAFGG